jgi:tetratricopeptide (TPR) repeat protein
MKRISIFAVTVLAIAGLTSAQTPASAPAAKKTPMAKTQPEYAAYQKFWNTADADEQIKYAEEFLKTYPESELKGYAYMAEMRSYQAKNDFNHLREFGEKILELDPNDLPTLITLATAIPERTTDNDLDKDQKRTAAETYAKRALDGIDKLPKPVPPATASDADKAKALDNWTVTTNDARSQAHYALGLVNMQRKSYQTAVDEFLVAAKLQNPAQPDPILYWRLGLAYEFNNKQFAEALKSYEKSVSLGGVKMGGKDQAAEDRDRVKKILEKK